MAHGDITSFIGKRYVLSAGVTTTIDTAPGLNNRYLMYGSGGSLEILGTGASAAAVGSGFLVPTSQLIPLNGPAAFIVATTGATTVFTVLNGYCGYAG